MLFFVRKLVEALLLPIGISGLLAITGTLLRRRSIVLAGVLTLYAFSTPIVGKMMMRSLERIYAPVAVAKSPTADAIVVLSGDNLRGTNAVGIQWGGTANRYFAGLDLAMAQKAKLLILSGGPRPAEAAILLRTAIGKGIPQERIAIVANLLTTEDEARAVSNIPGVHSILLVTSAYHMPRAALLFRARGLAVAPFPTDERVFSPQILVRNAFVPLSRSLDDSDAAMREYYGLLVYKTILLFGRGGS
jgi:uncharacterized SAM-binding protein YcdF (DUF218 family)